MAETTTKVKYKFGADELDLQDYITHLERNVKSYLDHLTNWSEGLRLEFSQVYYKYLEGLKDQLKNNTNRFYTNSMGTIFDNNGELSRVDNDNIDPVGSEYYYDNEGNRITTDDYNKLKDKEKKRYNTFSANRSVSTFLGTVGEALAQARRSKTTSSTDSQKKFDLSKNGFENWWINLNNPAGGKFDFAPYVEKDAVDENGVRGTTNRSKYLAEQLRNYLNSLEDLDYSGSTFKDKATYEKALNNAINNLANGYNSEDTIALNQAGLSNLFLNEYFGGKPKTEVDKAKEYIALQLQKAEDDKVLEEAEKLKRKEEADKYFKEYLELNPFTPITPLAYIKPDYSIAGATKLATDKYGIDPASDPTGERTKNAIRQYIDFKFLSDLMRGRNTERLRNTGTGEQATPERLRQHIYNNLDWAAKNNLFLDPRYLQGDKDQTSILGEGKWWVVPDSEDYNNWTFLAYNSDTHQYEERSMLLNDLLKERMAYSHYKPQATKNKEGGILKCQLGNKGIEHARKLYELALNKKKEQEAIKKEAEETDRTVELVTASKRKISEGLSGEDITRIVTAGLDVISAGSAYIPIYGTAVSAASGLASTFGNFGADMSDEAVTASQMWRNLGYGLGMDAIGLIPGLGTVAKVKKLSNILKPISRGIMWTLNTSTSVDVLNTIPSFLKLFTNPSDITTEDVRQLSVGLQAIAGLTRGRGGSRAAKKIEEDLVNKSSFNSIETDKGAVKLSQDQFDRFKKAKTKEEQNKVIHEVNPLANLNTQYRSKWGRVRHPFHKNPSIKSGTEWTDRDWSKEEYLPIGYTVKDGSVVPGRGTNLWLYDSILGNRKLNWKFIKPEKNPLYLKPLSPEEIKRNKRNSIDAAWLKKWETDPNFFRKQGGTLDLNKVRKFTDGGGMNYTLTGGGGVRKKNTYSFDSTLRLKAALDRIKAGRMTVDDANQFLRRHYGMYSKWNQAPMRGGDIGQYQTDYQGLGLNDEVIAPGFNTNYDVQSSNPTSGDSLTKKWTIDGIYDLITDDRRIFARAADYEGKLDKLNSDIALAKAAGYDYYLDPETLYYMLRPLESSTLTKSPIMKPTDPEAPKVNNPGTKKATGNDMLPPADPPADTPPNTLNNVLGKIFSNPTITYGLPRAMYADGMNRRMTDLTLRSMTPLGEDPAQDRRSISSSLKDEVLGEKTAGSYAHLADNHFTSDGDLWAAIRRQAALDGLAAIAAGKAKSDEILRQTSELAWLQEKENLTNRHEAAMFNRAQMWGTALDKAKVEAAYLSRKGNIWDTFWQQLEYEARTKQKEKEALSDRFAASDIHNESVSNLAKYAKGLSKESLDIWNQVLSGNTTPAQLQKDPVKWQLYQQAERALQLAESDLLRDYYGVASSPFAKARKDAAKLSSNWAAKIYPLHKKGGTISEGIAIAGIRAKTADAERFLRSIKACIDRNEKAIDRLSKSLYGIIKASILK